MNCLTKKRVNTSGKWVTNKLQSALEETTNTRFKKKRESARHWIRLSTAAKLATGEKEEEEDKHASVSPRVTHTDNSCSLLLLGFLVVRVWVRGWWWWWWWWRARSEFNHSTVHAGLFMFCSKWKPTNQLRPLLRLPVRPRRLAGGQTYASARNKFKS